jgi:hypothetical protein
MPRTVKTNSRRKREADKALERLGYTYADRLNVRRSDPAEQDEDDEGDDER